MASTEPDEEPRLPGDARLRRPEPSVLRAEAAPPARPLRAEDVPAALQLSAAAQWNQHADDWLCMLRLGQGWGIDAVGDDGRQRLAASVIVLPYGRDFAWVSMVLVLPEFRRRGLAQALLRHALAHLQGQGRFAVLDATPAGHAVYVQEGFVDTWSFARHRREAGPLPAAPPAGPSLRPLREDDWPAIEALDAPAFGASRLSLLRSLAQRLPQAAWVAEQGGRAAGYVLGRNGREAAQIGPLLATNAATAQALLRAALAAVADQPVYVDLLDHQQALRAALPSWGFAFQRPFTRMVHGAAAAPGDPTRIVLAAGPELG